MNILFKRAASVALCLIWLRSNYD